MALSSWDTLAWRYARAPGHEAAVEACRGEIVAPSGIWVSIYKNWLYVRDKKGWYDTRSFTEPTVAEVTHGVLRYKDINIAAARGPQDGVYAAVWYGYEYMPERAFEVMVGVGCYGYFEDWHVGVEKRSAQWLQGWLIQQAGEGVVPGVAADIPLLSGLHFNQGDAYFADILDADIPARNLGESEPTVWENIWKPEEADDDGAH